MKIKLAGFTVFSLVILMIVPVYADINNADLNKETFTIDDKFTISGTISDVDRLMLVASMKGPNGEKLVKNVISNHDGTFSFIPVDAGLIFKSQGEYTITVFTENQNIVNGTVIKLVYEKGVASVLPDYILELTKIGNQNIDETKELSFTASITDSTIPQLEFSLANQPTGATINKDTGIFTWTPTESQSGGHIFDIVVKSGVLEDRETITVTVNDKPVSTPEPVVKEPEPVVKEPEPVVKEPDTTEELGLASFVDEIKDPQSYVDRYENEASYKKWFDDNYSEYSSIYQAVGLEAPLEIPATFVDEIKDPQSYVDRYENEASYKKWFDDNYSEYSSIYQAVGLEAPEVVEPEVTEPIVKEPEFGECGEGTDLVNDECVVIEKSNGGGCLIATAAYGSEMAPQVQFLREIRDNQLMNTNSGASFMTGFNQFYYSFSPTIADMERENPMFREVVKIGITPLLSSLSLLSFAESEFEVLGYGIGVILMNAGMYFAAPAIIIFKARKYIKI